MSLKAAVVLAAAAGASACSNIIVTPEISADSSSMIAYNADSATLFGSLYHYSAAKHAEGTMRDVYDWDTGVYLGQIKEAPETYNVVGNMNQFGLTIGETTYGGVSDLQKQSKAIIDYGSLIWITLQRSKNAREAIKTIGSLLSEYGYASEGESFSIADQNEAWIMEIIGKGEYELGAVWVARKIPAGYVTAHANQARITTFPLDDPENCIYAPDTISFAKKYGFYAKDGKDEEFSFSDAYNPVSFEGARFCEARVWSFFGDIMGDDFAEQYLDYAQGYNLTNRMPLWVAPSAKLSLNDVFQHMRNHYENTPLDMTGRSFSDVGAAFGYMAQRAHPLTWEASTSTSTTTTNEKAAVEKTAEYFHERPIGTPQTGWNFVAQSRRWMPTELSGLLWFGVDDSSTTAHFPIYGSATSVPASFSGKGAQDGVTPPVMTFNFQSAFTVFNLVANWAYSRWDLIYPEVYSQILAVEAQFQTTMHELDEQAVEKYNREGPASAVQFVTEKCTQLGDSLVSRWGQFFGQLFMKYRDGYVITPSESSQSCGCSVANGAYDQSWLNRIVKDTKDHYKVPAEEQLLQSQSTKGPVRDPAKLELLSRR
mmetsp:Transcript_25489/g.42541  ORF Transcript_25489/g.42541 Transcript_25489/m.42541 type:complete len:596 (-) Transcript_25489:275-2062(-)